jgi:acetyl-CoA acyltransferase
MAAKKKKPVKKAAAKKPATRKAPAKKKKAAAKKPKKTTAAAYGAKERVGGKAKLARGTDSNPYGSSYAPAVHVKKAEVAILTALRSGLGRGVRGTLKDTRPDSYAATVVAAAVKAAGVDPKGIGDLVMGCAMPEAEQGMNVGRIIGVLAGLPDEVPAMTLNRFCSSGLEAVATVADRILAGRYSYGVGGGVESMSLVPMGGHRPSASPTLMDTLPGVYTPMGITAENVAAKYNVTRADQDAFAFTSHQRAVAALEAGRFKKETVTVQARIVDENGKARMEAFATDEGPRKDTTVEALGKLKPAFDKTGTVTAGNSSQITDGAAAVVLADAAWAKEHGHAARAFFRGYAVVGVDPSIMGVGPVPAIRKLLKDAGLSLNDIDLFEVNEAFAAQALYVQRDLGIDPAKLNVNGGAIALGHPLGCTGARQIATLIHELERRKARYGVVSMCVGGGMGAAGLIELAQ